MVKVAVVGAGFIGCVHANCCRKIDNADVVAIVDKEEIKGKKAAGEFNAKYYSDIDECLDHEKLDSVHICVPTFLHAEMVKKVARAGKHVLCEKPLALSLEEADGMIEAVRTNKVKSMVGLSMRFWPEYVAVKELIDSGKLGNPLFGYCERLAATPDWHEKKWGLDEKYSGGAAVDLHIHDLDYLIWLFGKPHIVKAQGVYNPKSIEHGGLVHIATSIGFTNGVSALAEGGWAFRGSFPFTMVIRVLCEKGTVEWIFRAGKNIEERGKQSDIIIYEPDGEISKLEVESSDAYFLECKYFIDCIYNDRPVERATFENGRAALELALAAVESAKENEIVKLY